jgi:hypothetical protein
VAKFRVKCRVKFHGVKIIGEPEPVWSLYGEIVSEGDSPNNIVPGMCLKKPLSKRCRIDHVYPDHDPGKNLRLEIYIPDPVSGLVDDCDWIGNVQCGDVLEII